MDARQRRDARIAARRSEEARRQAAAHASRPTSAPVPSRPPALRPQPPSGPRRHTLAELDAHFVRYDGREPGADHGPADAVWFECPEGHRWADDFPCSHTIPFTPAFDGTPRASPQSNGAKWDRVGDTIETLTLTPSIRANGPVCHAHIFVKNGRIEFCGDSR